MKFPTITFSLAPGYIISLEERSPGRTVMTIDAMLPDAKAKGHPLTHVLFERSIESRFLEDRRVLINWVTGVVNMHLVHELHHHLRIEYEDAEPVTAPEPAPLP